MVGPIQSALLALGFCFCFCFGQILAIGDGVPSCSLPVLQTCPGNYEACCSADLSLLPFGATYTFNSWEYGATCKPVNCPNNWHSCCCTKVTAVCPASSQTTPSAPGVTNSPNAPAVSLVPKPGDVVIATVVAIGHLYYYCLGRNAAGGYFTNYTGSANLYSTNGVFAGNWTLDINGTQTYIIGNGRAVTSATADSYTYDSKSSSTEGCYASLGDHWEATNGFMNNTRVTYITATNTTGGYPPDGATCPPLAYPAQINGVPYVWSVPYQTLNTFYSKYIPPTPPV